MTFVEMSDDRRVTLARFIRAQANLTDKNPPMPGPGEVRLNHEEALLCAEALEAQIRALDQVAARAGRVDS